jgi:hypothetical protein
MSTEVFCTYSCTLLWLAHSTNCCWALSDQNGMSYLAKKKSLMKLASIHRSYSTKKCKVTLLFGRYVLYV